MNFMLLLLLMMTIDHLFSIFHSFEMTFFSLLWINAVVVAAAVAVSIHHPVIISFCVYINKNTSYWQQNIHKQRLHTIGVCARVFGVNRHIDRFIIFSEWIHLFYFHFSLSLTRSFGFVRWLYGVWYFELLCSYATISHSRFHSFMHSFYYLYERAKTDEQSSIIAMTPYMLFIISYAAVVVVVVIALLRYHYCYCTIA